MTKNATTQKMKFSIKYFFSKVNTEEPNTQENKDCFTFTEKSLIENLIFICSGLDNLSLF